MKRPRRAGRVFSAVGFTVIGAVATLLLVSPPGHDGTRTAPAGPVEIGFAQDMIVHHGQAVTMAQSVRGRASPSVSQLAIGIELNQLREIGQMQGWLTLWNAPLVGEGVPMRWMAAGHPRAHGDTHRPMPGLASVEELSRLGELSGDALDALFLQLMIRHHGGAIEMATAAARLTTNPHVRDLATRMAIDQRQETAILTGLLPAPPHRP